MGNRTNNIYGVTIAKFAHVYVEAESPEKAMEIVGGNMDEIYGELMSEIDDQFDDSNMEVHSCDAYSEEVDDYMENIWTPDGILTYDEYVEELEEQEDEEELTPSLFDMEE